LNFQRTDRTSPLTFQRATGDDLTLTHQLCIADGANDNAPLCLTKSQLAAVLSRASNDNTPAVAAPRNHQWP
jgi:hypothetical protein